MVILDNSFQKYVTFRFIYSFDINFNQFNLFIVIINFFRFIYSKLSLFLLFLEIKSFLYIKLLTIIINKC